MYPTGGRLAEIVAALEIRYGRPAAVEGPGLSDDDLFARFVAVLIGRATNARKAAASVEALASHRIPLKTFPFSHQNEIEKPK